METEAKNKFSLKLNKKAAITIVFIAIAILLIIVISNIFKSFRNANITGNIYNMGLAIERDGEIFYNKYEKGIIKLKNGKEYQITDETAYSINIEEDIIYYLTVSNTGTIDIKSVEKNGNNLKKIGTIYTSISKIYVVDGYIYYYSNENNMNGIAKMDIEGNNRTVITTANIQDFEVIGNEIYFTDNINNLYKMSTTGINLERIISDFIIKKFQVIEKWIFYYDEEEGALCKVKTDGTSKTIVSVLIRTDTFNITGNRIYFFNAENKEIGSVNLKGDDYKKIITIQSNKTKINVCGDVLYYLDTSKDESQIYQMYRVKTNGSATSPVEY